jgi:GntR family transcriptional regulator/MocR family aminotransferase
LKAALRLALLVVGAQEWTAISDHNYHHELHYGGRPVLFDCQARTRRGSSCYIGTLSKILAPAFRIGYIVAPRVRQPIDGSSRATPVA